MAYDDDELDGDGDESDDDDDVPDTEWHDESYEEEEPPSWWEDTMPDDWQGYDDDYVVDEFEIGGAYGEQE